MFVHIKESIIISFNIRVQNKLSVLLLIFQFLNCQRNSYKNLSHHLLMHIIILSRDIWWQLIKANCQKLSPVFGLICCNPTYQAFVTLQPDWLPFNSLGAGVANKRQYKTAKVPDLPHIFSLTKLQ